jgi:hypothetical protein
MYDFVVLQTSRIKALKKVYLLVDNTKSQLIQVHSQANSTNNLKIFKMNNMTATNLSKRNYNS